MIEGRLEKSSSGVTCHAKKVQNAECRILFYCCIVFNLESAAFACSTAVFFFFFLCELQWYQSVCKAMENRALHHASGNRP